MSYLDRERILRWIISLLVSAILLAQAATLPLKLSGNSPHTWYWPIIDYPMYEFSHQAGEYVISQRTLEVVHRDDSVDRLTAEDLGLNFWNFLYLTGRLQRGNVAAMQQLMEIYDRGSELSKVRVFSPPVILTKQGAAKAEPKLLGELTFDEAPARLPQ